MRRKKKHVYRKKITSQHSSISSLQQVRNRRHITHRYRNYEALRLKNSEYFEKIISKQMHNKQKKCFYIRRNQHLRIHQCHLFKLYIICKKQKTTWRSRNLKGFEVKKVNYLKITIPKCISNKQGKGELIS